MSKIAVFCTAKSEALAGRIVEDLKGSYFSKHNISVVFPDTRRKGRSLGLTGTKVLEAAAAGSLLGGALGWLAGVGAMTIPGASSLIAVGPIVTTLGGVALGGVAGAIVGLGMPDLLARHYESKVKNGEVLILVHTKDREEACFAKEIFKHQGAEDISSTHEVPAPNPLQALAGDRWPCCLPVRFRFW